MKIEEKNSRNEGILLDVVEEYIRTAGPVSSHQILNRYKYSLSSATIRNIMAELTEAGFLAQPHTSAGRIPTHKAYRFYVDKVELGARKPFKSKKEKQDETLRKELRKALNVSEDYFARFLSQRLAELTNNMAFACILGVNHFYKEGLLRTLSEPEFLNSDNIRMLIEYADLLERRVEHLYDSIQDDIHVYIGPEYEKGISPFSLMAFSSELPSHERAVFGLVGPMRMHYEKNLDLLDSIKVLFDDLKLSL